MDQADYRAYLTRTVAIINGKGGIGKSSLAAAWAALAALRESGGFGGGLRVLLIDLDRQGNCGHDLGYKNVGLGDDGEGLSRLVQFGHPPLILRDVRAGLDVIPGGKHLDFLASVLDVVSQRDGADAGALLLARRLAPTIADYDLCLLDCPPGSQTMQQAALAMARWIVIPTKTDASSIEGMEEVADTMAQVRRWNPTLAVLAVLLFGVTSSARAVREEARVWIVETLQDQAPVLKATIRHVEAVAVQVRRRGQLPHELEMAAVVGATAAMARAATGLAGDYEKVVAELLTLMINAESEEKGPAA